MRVTLACLWPVGLALSISYRLFPYAKVEMMTVIDIESAKNMTKDIIKRILPISNCTSCEIKKGYTYGQK
jgi:hypothetical protein